MLYKNQRQSSLMRLCYLSYISGIDKTNFIFMLFIYLIPTDRESLYKT